MKFWLPSPRADSAPRSLGMLARFSSGVLLKLDLQRLSQSGCKQGLQKQWAENLFKVMCHSRTLRYQGLQKVSGSSLQQVLLGEFCHSQELLASLL